MIRHDLADWDVGHMVGRDRSTISRIRRGVQMPDWPTMLSIYDATSGKVRPNDFLPLTKSR
jgi:hypothetical protein